MDLPPPMDDGPLSVGQAFLVVEAIFALTITLLAAHARVRWGQMWLLVFVSLFVMSSVMMQVETLWFNASLKLPLSAIAQLAGDSAIVATIIATVAMLLFRPQPEAALPLPPHMALRIALLALIYVALYYGAGIGIAWQSEAVRAYYENGAHVPALPTFAFQIVRGTAWALIALFVVTRLNGSLVRRALIMGCLFAVTTAVQLLFPTPFFPWAVRAAHLVEIASSEFAYGVIATVILTGFRRQPAATRALVSL